MLSWCHINPQIIRGINILIATHSPFVLSDVPLSNTLYLDDGVVVKKSKETFCGNIHEMLGENFFLKYSIGNVARKNVEEILKLYNEFADCDDKVECISRRMDDWSRYKYVSYLIADEYLQGLVQRMMDEMERYLPDTETIENIDKKIAETETQLQQLRVRKENLYD